MMSKAVTGRAPLNRMTFWMIWLVGGGPLLLAMFLYFSAASDSGLWSGQGSQKGELLQTGQTLEQWAVKDGQGNPLAATGLWQIVLAVPQHCTERCAWWQTQLVQLHRALGKNQQRVQWLSLEGARTEESARQQLEQQGAGIWLADPHGNLVLRYRLEQPPQDLLKDLRRLLKVSRIG
ncbi:MAG: hypothetical protein OIF57_19345 [Marinobacterium sp.]|nr:hypothetical protein [Marinobacterium sp.]